ncbi:hypothetical protein V2J09_016116 [Rumex salicifolius]
MSKCKSGVRFAKERPFTELHVRMLHQVAFRKQPPPFQTSYGDYNSSSILSKQKILSRAFHLHSQNLHQCLISPLHQVKTLINIPMDVVRNLVNEEPVVIFSQSACCVSRSIKKLISSYGANPTVCELDKISNGQEVERELLSMGIMPSVPAVPPSPREAGSYADGGWSNVGLEKNIYKQLLAPL